MLEFLQALPLADLIRRSTWAFPAIEVVHLVGIALLFGTILVVDLALLGVLRASPLKEAIPSLLTVTKTGVVLVAVSGALLFISDSLELWNNPAFRLKIIAIVIAILNALLFQSYLAEKQKTGAVSVLKKMSIGSSLVLWTGILVLGRAIAYV
ncbi:hypothetical protein SJS43_02475 [Aeromonas caviae]|uniref:hypothetical protein n=1 Tax=Aeromonas caviae TaxID=648 RepID=UPI0029DC9469|nr:hypothetical protein [Aeromonas caviae]MDX7817959.1 hypothetical protein [Aeromonas caviae]